MSFDVTVLHCYSRMSENTIPVEIVTQEYENSIDAALNRGQTDARGVPTYVLQDIGIFIAGVRVAQKVIHPQRGGIIARNLSTQRFLQFNGS